MKKISLKICISAVLWITYAVMYNLFYPVSITPVAKKLVEDSTDSVVTVHAYEQLWQYGWIPLLLLTLLILRKDIKMILNRIRTIREEYRNE